MKTLIVAHPDDEIIWFNPAEFDQIVFVFEGRRDKPEQGQRRRAALAAHPLRERITCLGLIESGALRDSSEAARTGHEENYRALCRWLADLKTDEVVTHNAMGEYQHPDHILVHNACFATLNCPVNGKDPALYREIKKAYTDSGCWTWHA